MTSFGVMREAIVYSIQNRLLLLLVKSQVWTTTRTWVISNFQRLLKMGNYFCGLAVRGIVVWNHQMIYMYIIMENRPDFQVITKNKIFCRNNNSCNSINLHSMYFVCNSFSYIILLWWWEMLQNNISDFFKLNCFKITRNLYLNEGCWTRCVCVKVRVHLTDW